MKAILYDISCQDILTGLPVPSVIDYVPETGRHYALELEVHVQFSHDDSLSTFTIDFISTDCTEFYFKRYFTNFQTNAAWIKGLIVCNDEFNGKKLHSDISEYITSCHMQTRSKTLLMLNRYMNDEEMDRIGELNYFKMLINQSK